MSTRQLILVNERRAHLQSKAGKFRNTGLDELGVYQALKAWAVDNCEDGSNYPDEKLQELASAAMEPDALDITQPAVQAYIVKAYWAGSSTNGKISWTHPNIAKFLESHGLKLVEIMPYVGEGNVSGKCALCENQTAYASTTRTGLQGMAKYFSNGTARCLECFAKAKAEKVAQQKAAEEKAALAKQQAAALKQEELATYHKLLVMKHGKDLVTDILCSGCGDGFLVAKIGSAQVPFLGCSRFNYYRSSSCKYTSSISNESIAELLPIFQKRLEAVAAAAKEVA